MFNNEIRRFKRAKIDKYPKTIFENSYKLLQDKVQIEIYKD